MRLLISGILMAVTSASPAWAGKDMRAVTPSGMPDMVFRGATAQEASGKLASRCMDLGLAVATSSPSEVVCQIPLSAGKSILGQMLVGNSYSTPVQQFVKFTIAPIMSDTRVQASSWMETQMAFGQIRRQPIQGDGLHNDVMGFMEAAGAKYLPGTTFPNHAFLGLGPGGGEPASFRGKSVTGLRVTQLVKEGTLGRAGAQIGDLLIAINGKGFRTSAEFQKRLQGITIGEQMTFTVLRDGSEAVLNAVAGRRAAVTLESDLAAAPMP